jgi:hypothetical protein
VLRLNDSPTLNFISMEAAMPCDNCHTIRRFFCFCACFKLLEVISKAFDESEGTEDVE